MNSDRTYKYVVIGLIACSMLMYEILLTRICALRLFFHFAFLVISNCLLAIGASGALIMLFQDAWRPRERSLLFLFSALYLLSFFAVCAFFLTYPLPAGMKLSEPAHFIRFTVFNLVGAVPFFFGGLVVGMLLSFNADRVNRLYGTDLIGAALGCIFCPLLLGWSGAAGVIMAAAILVVVALVATVPPEWKKIALPAGGVAVAAGLWLLPSLDALFPLPGKGTISLSKYVEAETEVGIIHSAWSSNSRIDLHTYPPPGGARFVFGRGTKTGGQPPIPEQLLILQDASAGTLVVNFTEQPDALEIIERSMYSAALQLKSSPRVFIIGAGGFNDVWAAKAAGARYVKAVELNAPILDIHREVIPHFSGAILQDPSIELVVGEGRSALMQDDSRYDVIQMTGIDTWTALASGAYVLAENYLYTREALMEMYDHLDEGGVIQIIRFAMQMESLRMVSNIHAAFENMGVGDLSRSIAALQTTDSLMAIMVKKGAFTDREVATLRRFADENGIEKVYLPGMEIDSPLTKFIETEDKAGFIADFPRNISPTTDDRPYFFNYTRWNDPLGGRRYLSETTAFSQGNPIFILGQLGVSIVLSVLLILLPTARLRQHPHQGASRYLVYFAGLGLGFILIEIAALQKFTLFLGHPIYSITVTLFSVLLFTGLGSLFLANRIDTNDSRIWGVPLGLTLLVAVIIFTSPWLVSTFIGLPLLARIAITVIILAPVSLLLGIPFAYGIRVLDERNPTFIPWAWAINGCFSVVGSILTVVISMNFGFNAVLCTAVVVYAVAVLALRREVSA